MRWKERVNRTLRRIAGLELRRAYVSPAPELSPAVARRAAEARAKPRGDRLLSAPVFILSPVRSGSTLMRVLLNSHSQLHAPHELHLCDVRVDLSDYSERAMAALGLNREELEQLLWDHLLYRELEKSGKRIFVNKTPNDIFIRDRIVACWPDARFIFLLRHPLAVLNSWHAVRSFWSVEEATTATLRYLNAVEQARHELPGLTVRYERLTASPETETKRVCEFLGLDWEPEMLEYGKRDPGRFEAGLGDWGARIKSGRVHPARALPGAEAVPEALRDICVAWGYLDESVRVRKETVR